MLKHYLFKDIKDPFDDEGNEIDWEQEKMADIILGLEPEDKYKREEDKDDKDD